jgi:DNA primase
MEGNTDVILAHQYGLTNAVATLGTALTESHVSLFKRFARRVVLVFDGDEAGQKATARAIDKFLAQEVDLRILSLPEGLDPADFLPKFGLEKFQRLLDEATEAWELKLQLAIKEFGVDSIDSRQRVLDQMLESLARVPNFSGSPRETALISRLTNSWVKYDEATVRKRLKELRNRAANPASIKESSEQAEPKPRSFDLKNPSDLVEAELLEILLTEPQLVETLQVRISPEQFHNPSLKHLLQLAFDLWERGDLPSFERFMAELEDPLHKQTVMRLDDLARQKKIAQKLIADNTQGIAEGSIGYLEEVVRRLLLSNERQKFESLKGSLVHAPAKPSATDGPKPAGELNKEHLRYLLEAQKFHAKRANS